MKSDLVVVPRTVQAELVSKLRSAIVSGRFMPGQRLVEETLCVAMNVSRTSVREALRRLEGERLVVSIPNKGPFVAQISWEEAGETYQVRALLEAEAVAQFAVRATDDDLKRMRKALLDFATAVAEDDSIGRVSATTEFYDVILAGCGNRVIREILEGLRARVNLLRTRSMSRPGRSRFSVEELRRIYEAIEARDPEAARSAAIEHLDAACNAGREAYAPVAERSDEAAS